MDASDRGLLLNKLADAIERDSAYLAVSNYYVTLQEECFNVERPGCFHGYTNKL